MIIRAMKLTLIPKSFFAIDLTLYKHTSEVGSAFQPSARTLLLGTSLIDAANPGTALFQYNILIQ